MTQSQWFRKYFKDKEDRKKAFQKALIRIFDNFLGRWYLGMPRRKKIARITPTGVHYYTGEISKKNRMPIICTGVHSPGQKAIVFQKLKNLANVFSLFVFLPFFPKMLLPLVIGMADTSWTSPGTMADDGAVGTEAWNNVNNAKVEDGSNAYVDESIPGIPKFSHYLKATNFGFSIPSGATIDGIVVEIEKDASDNDPDEYVKDSAIKIVKADGSIGTTNRATGAYWPVTEAYVSHGASNDKWGESWTAENINHANFGVVVSVVMWLKGFEPLCLSKNTEISTPDGYKNITDIKIGDEVFSFNEKTKEIEKDIVTDAWILPKQNRGIYYIHTDKSVVEAKHGHNFYVEGEWKRADELKVGDILTGESLEKLKITKIEIIQMNEHFYHFSVKNNHNYFANGVLVHNATVYAYVDHIRIKVYYTEAAIDPPTISTQACTNIEATSAQGNGNITDTGGENCHTRGFCYMQGTSGDPTTANDKVYDNGSGSYGTGGYNKSITGLSTGTSYRVRAYAINSEGTGYGTTVQILTKPAAPTNVLATDGVHTDKVVITWNKSTGATGYKVYEGANLLDTLGDVDTFDDTNAPAPSITPGSTVAGDGASTAHVSLSLSGTQTNNGASRTYKVKAFNATGNSVDSGTNTGYRKPGTLNYQWQRSSGDGDSGYSNIDGATSSTYNDTTAPAPTVTPGDAAATDGEYFDKVALSIFGQSANVGAGRWYKCILNAAGATEQTSVSNRGYRGVGGLTYQWQRSAGDSDGDYSNIDGATTASYNDTEAPADGSGRYYKCIENANGANQQISSSDRGNRAVKSYETFATLVCLEKQIQATAAVNAILEKIILTTFAARSTLEDEEIDTFAGLANLEKLALSTFAGLANLEKEVVSTFAGLANFEKPAQLTFAGISTLEYFSESTFAGLAILESPVYVIRTFAGIVNLETFKRITFAGISTFEFIAKITFAGLTNLVKEAVSIFAGLSNLEREVISTFSSLSTLEKWNVSAFAALAILKKIGQTILVSPLHLASQESPVTFVWEIPIDAEDKNIHARIQVDKTSDGFEDLEIDKSSMQGGFEYWDGGEWVEYPQSGVASAYYGNQARYTTSLTLGQKWWRVRGGTSQI